MYVKEVEIFFKDQSIRPAKFQENEGEIPVSEGVRMIHIFEGNVDIEFNNGTGLYYPMGDIHKIKYVCGD